MTKNFIQYFLFVVLSAFVYGCDDQNFTLYDPLEKDFTIYAVLDNRLDYCLLKVHNIYLDSSKMKPEGGITAVLEQNNGDQFYLKDTIIRDGGKFACFKIPVGILKRGAGYKIVVMKEGYNTRWAECTYHKKPDLWVDRYSANEDNRTKMKWDVCFSKNASEVFIVKTYIDYEILNNGEITKKIIELPLYAKISPLHSRYNPSKFIYEYEAEDLDILYPTFQDISNSDYMQVITGNDNYIVRFDDDGLYINLKKIGNDAPKEKIKINSLFSVLYSIDKNYYRSVMVKQNERWSIRLDQGYYWTNVMGYQKFASGFFGAFTADTIKFNMLPTHISKYGYIDGQKY